MRRRIPRLEGRSAALALLHGFECSLAKSLKSVQNAIAGSKEDERAAIDYSERRRRPGAVKNVWSNGFAVASKEFASAFVEHYQTWCVRSADPFMSVVHAGP